MPSTATRPATRRPAHGSATRMVGALLGTLRRASGHTQQSLADAAAISMELVASIEQGRRPLKPDQARLLDELLDSKGALTTAVANLPEVDRVPVWAEQYVDLEAEAVALSWYENQVLPGLLQTEDYARAVLTNHVPAFSDDEIAAQTASRLERQAILQRTTPPTISFVVWEPVLSLRLGSAAEYREQLRHLRRCADLPFVTLQVLPLTSATHAGLDGPFTVLETLEHHHLGYTESQRGSHLLSSPDEVSILARKYAMLRTQALTAEDTTQLLDRLGD